MKNHRDICSATEAGYTEYDGLPGRIKTGCPNTPGFKSRYCSLHDTMASKRQNLSFPDLERNGPGYDDVASKEETQAVKILETKALRSSTYYKVSW